MDFNTLKALLGQAGYNDEGDEDTETQAGKQALNDISDKETSDSISPTASPLDFAIPGDMMTSASIKGAEALAPALQRAAQPVGDYSAAAMQALKSLAYPGGELATEAGSIPMVQGAFREESPGLIPKLRASIQGGDTMTPDQLATEAANNGSQTDVAAATSQKGATDDLATRRLAQLRATRAQKRANLK